MGIVRRWYGGLLLFLMKCGMTCGRVLFVEAMQSKPFHLAFPDFPFASVSFPATFASQICHLRDIRRGGAAAGT